MSAERLNSIRQRMRTHQAKVQQLEGKRQSLQEQRARYVEELTKAGLTPEQLPARIEQIDLQLAGQLDALETALASVGA